MSFIASLGERSILVLGGGVTGEAVARYLSTVAKEVRIADQAIPAMGEDLDLSGISLAIVSPGFRLDHPWIAEVRAGGIEILSEIDLAWRIRSERNPDQRWLALTGTNGKTTTVQMAEAILKEAGMSARACGNVGDTVIDAVTSHTFELLILELSSFQLAWSSEARFTAAAILNIAEDHLDWHGNFSNYAEAKFKIAERAEILIANKDDAEISSRLGGHAVRLITYTLGTPAPHQIGLVENLIVDRAFVTDEAEVLFELGDLKDAIPHNLSNAMAAAALARSIGISPAAISAALRRFELDHHRLETVRVAGDIRWIDDSKATNPHAALAAIKSQLSVVWIAGGLSKGADMNELVAQGKNRLKSAILIGADAPKIESALKLHAPQIPIHHVESSLTGREVMREVVRIAKSIAVAGDSVLLAPACASMDQFKNYAERGDLFAEAVRESVHEE